MEKTVIGYLEYQSDNETLFAPVHSVEEAVEMARAIYCVTGSMSALKKVDAVKNYLEGAA